MDGMGDDLDRELAFLTDGADLDRVAAIIRDSGESFDNTLSRVQEHYPALTPYQQQLEAKRRIVVGHPDGGPELWERTLGRRAD